MDGEAFQFPDPTTSDDALRAACTLVRDRDLSAPSLLNCWLALQQGWRAHMERHERYTQSRLRRRDPQAAARVECAHWDVARKLEQRAIDLELGNVCAGVSSQIVVDAVLEHLLAEADCKPAAPRRRTRAAGQATRGGHDEKA